MLRDSATTVVVVVRTRPRAIPLAMITMRNQLMGFLFFPIWVWGSAWRPAGAPLSLKCKITWPKRLSWKKVRSWIKITVVNALRQVTGINELWIKPCYICQNIGILSWFQELFSFLALTFFGWYFRKIMQLVSKETFFISQYVFSVFWKNTFLVVRVWLYISCPVVE